jgi:TPP-dependent pyruvate/acetoin dehydrogenase alpha subunit
VIDYTKEDLQAFEEDIRQCFLRGEIRYPVHFSAGNESQLIQIFKENNIGDDDWCFCSHRNHLTALLKGIPKEWLKEQIIKGNSMHIMSGKYKFFSSSIVGGSLYPAVGVAESGERVFCFVGDMCALTGKFHEAVQYSLHFNLPITFIIECNGLSTNTPSYETVNIKHKHDYNIKIIHEWGNGKVLRYCYERQVPHINVGQFVSFH